MKDDKPNATNRYLTEQLNQFGLAYLHMVEPRVAGYMDVEVEDSTFDLNHFRKLFKGTFIAAGTEQLHSTKATCMCIERVSLKVQPSVSCACLNTMYASH